MSDWTVFLATCAGCAATLAGLVFVASQLHIDAFSDDTSPWSALAQSTLAILSTVLGLTLTFLIPRLPLEVRAYVTLALAVVVLSRMVRTWWRVVRSGESTKRHRIEESFWLLLAPFVAYGWLMFGAIQLLWGDENDGLITVGSAFVGMFGIALQNSWRLVVLVRVRAR